MSVVDNPERLKLILRGCHIIADENFDIFNNKNNRRIEPLTPTVLELQKGYFKKVSVIMILDRVQVVYIIGEKVTKFTRACIKVQGENAELHHISKTLLKTSLNSFKENDIFLNGNGLKIIYFSKEMEDFLFFRQLDGKFIVDNISSEITTKDKIIGNTKSEIIASIVEDIYV